MRVKTSFRNFESGQFLCQENSFFSHRLNDEGFDGRVIDLWRKGGVNVWRGDVRDSNANLGRL